MEKLERISKVATISRHERVLVVDRQLIQAKSEDAERNPRFREIHILHRGDSDPLQRMVNAVQPATYVRPHRHVQPGKAEAVVLLNGSLGFMSFTEDGVPLDFVHLHPTKALVVDCREGVWHTFFALEPNTVVFEAKAGPHNTATDKEFAPWAPEEGVAEADAYLSRLKHQFFEGLLV